MGPMERQRENQVIQSVLEGDKDAYAILVNIYKDRIFNLAYRMTGNYDDASDLAQETFIRAFENLHRFDLERPFFTWLYTIGLNIIRNHLKKDKRQRHHESGTVSDHGRYDTAGDPEGDAMTRENTQMIEQCMEGLSAEMREAVILRFFQDVSFDDMADIMGISSSAAKMRVYRGLERIAGCMKEGTEM